MASEQVLATKVSSRKKLTFWNKYENQILVLASLIVFLSIWEAIARSGVFNQLFFAGPVAISQAFISLMLSGELLTHLRVSATEFAYGSFWAILLGIPLGLALGVFKRIEMLLSPYLMAFYAIPRIAFYPLIVVWFGLGLNSKAILVFFSVFFPVCINTWAGAKTVDPVLIKAGRSFGATKWQLFTKIILPYSLPFVIAGIRIGAGIALIAVYIGELMGSEAGIGYLIVQAGFAFKADKLFVGVIMLAGIGVAFSQGIGYLERRIAPWRQNVKI